jgi:NADH-quinone oxidoreductase subunit I
MKDFPVAIVVKKPRLSLVEKLYVFEVAAGMWVTILHFLRNLLNPSDLPTLNYPEEKRHLAANFRALLRLLKKDSGELKCTACKMCANICPSHCISVEMALTDEGKPKKTPARYDLDISRCIFCGFCVEVCPFDAIDMASGMYELAGTDRTKYVYTKEKLSAY